MRKISANYIFPVASKPLKNGVLIIDKEGLIVDLIDTNGKLKQDDDLELYNGAIVPGFVNAHCHLELSYLKNKILNVNGLHDFLRQFIGLREFTQEREHAIEAADLEMQQNGIVAVGDISNNNSSFVTKMKSKIDYHTFIEIFAPEPSKAQTVFERGVNLANECKSIYSANNKKASVSLAPHAPYSVSPDLFKMIAENLISEKQFLNIHNQESSGENQLYIDKTGILYDAFSALGIDFSSFKPSGKNSLPTYTEYFKEIEKAVFVHNIYTRAEDIKAANSLFQKTFWVICPFSNLFLEGKIADLNLFIANNQKLTLGTDSLASNRKLSILEEMKIISREFPEISFETILKWATLNGAEALGLEHKFGSFEVGKKAGINLIKNFDFNTMKLSEHSDLQVIS